MAILSHTEQDLLDWLFTLFDSGQPRNMAMASMETMQEQSDMIGMATNTSLPQKRGWEDEIGAGLTDKKWPGWDCTNLWTQKWPGWDCKNLTYSGLWWVLTVDTCMCRKCCNWILQNEFLPLAHYHILTSLNSTVLIL